MSALSAIDPVATAVAERAALARAADIAALASESRNTIPLLAALRLKGDGDCLFVSGANMDVSIDVRVPAPADIRFDLAIPATLLRNVLKKAPKAADMIAFTAPELVTKTRPGSPKRDANGAHIVKSDGTLDCDTIEVSEFNGPVLLDFDAAVYKLNALPTSDWSKAAPKGPRRGREADGAMVPNPTFLGFAMDGGDLYDALDRVAFAMSHEETRYYLNGVYMHAAPGSPAWLGGTTDKPVTAPVLRFVATDGHRLARQDMPIKPGGDAMSRESGAIIPRFTVDLLRKLLKPVKGATAPTVDIELDPAAHRIRFMISDVTVTSKLVEGTYPDYQRVTPSNNDKRIAFAAADMQEAIAAVSTVASTRGGKAVKLTLQPADGRIIVSCTNPDNGTAEMTVAAHAIGGFTTALEIGFNTDYLAEIIKESGGFEIELAVHDAGAPVLVSTPTRPDWCAVLMPVRV